MAKASYESTVFINCPIDEEYAPLLEAAIFCCVYLGFNPRLATIRLEAGENRLEKILQFIKASKFSIHDLSRCKSKSGGEAFRMNMPFEFGIDFGFRQSGNARFRKKKFLIFEENRFDLKPSLSDIAGQDVAHHDGSFELIIRRIREFLKVEAGCAAPGPSRIILDFATFQAWLILKKIGEGHSEQEAINLPTRERIEEMEVWISEGKPDPVVSG